MNELTINRTRQINQFHKQNMDNLLNTKDNAIEIGKLLTEEKKGLSYGEWIIFVRGNYIFDERQAQKYMEIYNNQKLLNTNSSSYLPINSLIKYIRQIKNADKKRGRIAEIINIQTGEILTPKGIYDIIITDPPWPYGTQDAYDSIGFRGTTPYPEQSIDEIKDKFLTIKINEDCILWLWTTNKFMREAFYLIDAWGFRDVSILTWDKEKFGTGRWLRSQTEHCIMAVRGKPIINLTNQSTIIREKSREHSRKPEIFYNMVKELCIGRTGECYSRFKRTGIEQILSLEGNKFDGE